MWSRYCIPLRLQQYARTEWLADTQAALIFEGVVVEIEACLTSTYPSDMDTTLLDAGVADAQHYVLWRQQSQSALIRWFYLNTTGGLEAFQHLFGAYGFVPLLIIGHMEDSELRAAYENLHWQHDSNIGSAVG